MARLLTSLFVIALCAADRFFWTNPLWAPSHFAATFFFALAAYFWHMCVRASMKNTELYKIGLFVPVIFYLLHFGQLIHVGWAATSLSSASHMRVVRFDVQLIAHDPFKFPVGFTTDITIEGQFPKNITFQTPEFVLYAANERYQEFTIDAVNTHIENGKATLQYRFLMRRYSGLGDKKSCYFADDGLHKELSDMQIYSSFKLIWNFIGPYTHSNIPIDDLLNQPFANSAAIKKIEDHFPDMLGQFSSQALTQLGYTICSQNNNANIPVNNVGEGKKP
jgi:hypothetical protein